MMAEIAAPGAGALAGADALLPGAEAGCPDGWVGDEAGSEWPPSWCEHPAISNDAASSAAIRIPSG